MTRPLALQGRRFGRLTVTRRDGSIVTNDGKSYSAWLCACDCGGTRRTRGTTLRLGLATSCGCGRRARAVVQTWRLP